MTMMDKSSRVDIERVKQIIKFLDDKEFDGHTEFYRLTNEEKLIWIFQISLFIFEIYNKCFIDK